MANPLAALVRLFPPTKMVTTWSPKSRGGGGPLHGGPKIPPPPKKKTAGFYRDDNFLKLSQEIHKGDDLRIGHAVCHRTLCCVVEYVFGT